MLAEGEKIVKCIFRMTAYAVSLVGPNKFYKPLERKRFGDSNGVNILAQIPFSSSTFSLSLPRFFSAKQ